MRQLQETEQILEKIDKVTDRMAASSEEKIRRVLDKGERITKKPLEKLKDFFKDED